MKHDTFQSGTGLVFLHRRDVADVAVESGAPLARHIPLPTATRPVAAAAALSFERPSRGTRAAAAGSFGATATAARATRNEAHA